MSIKTIEDNYIGMDKGLAKRINKGAEKLVFDILQSTQYSTPIPSTVRELVTNACDAQREKEMAIEILTGVKQASDYYITRDGEQYSDSNFDPSYYDLANLSIKSHIEVVYQHNQGIGYCDILSIKDYGVGIGAKRLEGILELGYSTKRNTSQNFGAFGLGAKVALSTGVDFYTIETVYNGKRFKANCFNYKTDFIIPKFNLVTGQINPSITLSDGSIVYYEDTIDQNWTQVSLGVKSHNSSRFREAVEEQLNYLDNVRFYEQYGPDSVLLEKEFKSKIIYNSKNLIVSTNNYLRKPHIVIVKEEGAATGINYGYVDFRELEMQDLYGPVGLKCPVKQSYIDDNGEEVILQDGVEVTPSREKVIWSDATKAFIQKLIDAAADEVTELVEKELLETDFLKWLDTCRQVIGGRATNKHSDDPSERTLAILSNIIDTKAIKPKYHPNPSIKFTSIPSTLNGFSVKIHNQNKKNTMSDLKMKTEYEYISEGITHWDQIGDRKVFYRTGNANKYKDFYLHRQYGPFITIKKTNLNYLEDQIATAKSLNTDYKYHEAEYEKKVNNQNLIEPLIKASENYLNYDEIELPDNIKELFDGAEEAASIYERGVSLTPEERRKLNSQIVAYTLRPDNHRNAGNHYYDYVWDKVEPTLRTVINSTIPTYYGTDEDANKLKLAAAILSNFNKNMGKFLTHKTGSYWYGVPYGDKGDTCYYFECLPDRCQDRFFQMVEGEDYSGQTQLLKLSESNTKHVRDLPNYRHIDEFFRTIDVEGNYTCHPAVKLFANHVWAKQFPIWDYFGSYRESFELDFIDDRYNKIYQHLLSIYNKFDSIVLYGNDAVVVDLRDEMTKLFEFETLCAADISDDIKAELSAKYFVLSDIPGVKVLDPKFMELVRFADEFARDSKFFLPRNNGSGKEYEEQVKIYLKAVQALEIPIPELD
jgi:hypothetical protein